MPEPMTVGGCTFNGWRYATWPLVSAGVEDRGFRVAARVWPILAFGFLDADRALIERDRETRSVLVPWENVREIRLRRHNDLSLRLVDGWRLRFFTPSEPLDELAARAHAYLAGRPERGGDA